MMPQVRSESDLCRQAVTRNHIVIEGIHVREEFLVALP
jgi:hypothetical protein